MRSQPKDCQGGWKLLVSCSTVTFSEMTSGTKATTLTLSPTSVGGLVALNSNNGVLGDLKPLDRIFGAVTADDLTLQGGLTTSIIHRCSLYNNTQAHSHQHFLNRQLTGRKIISNNVAYHHSS